MTGKPSDGPAGQPAGPLANRWPFHGSKSWYFWASIFSLYLVAPLWEALRSDRPWLWRAAVVAVTLVYAGSYIGLLWPARTRPIRDRAALLAGMVLLGSGLVALTGVHQIGLLSYVLVSAAVLLPSRWALATCAVILAGMLGVSALQPDGPYWNPVAALGSVAVAMLGMMGLIRSNIALREAREQIATLAVAEERARLARDLHDVLGHSLTTITVKAGLARRLLESGASERAAAEVADVERLGRQALTEVRATVSAQRVASLPAEIASAHAVLAAAGIRADLPQAVDDVAPQYHETFAYVLREAITNVVRHSGAQSCAVRLGPSWVEVRDDGAGCAKAGAGHGLAGLAERLAALGGTLDAGRAPEGGFRLSAQVRQ